MTTPCTTRLTDATAGGRVSGVLPTRIDCASANVWAYIRKQNACSTSLKVREEDGNRMCGPASDGGVAFGRYCYHAHGLVVATQLSQ